MSNKSLGICLKTVLLNWNLKFLHHCSVQGHTESKEALSLQILCYIWPVGVVLSARCDQHVIFTCKKKRTKKQEDNHFRNTLAIRYLKREKAERLLYQRRPRDGPILLVISWAAIFVLWAKSVARNTNKGEDLEWRVLSFLRLSIPL